jgi:hypothetical protein
MEEIRKRPKDITHKNKKFHVKNMKNKKQGWICISVVAHLGLISRTTHHHPKKAGK